LIIQVKKFIEKNHQNTGIRKRLFPVTILVWGVFMLMTWVYYVFELSNINGIVQPHKLMYLGIGLSMLMMGMCGYFFIRTKNWNQLSGGIIPKIDMYMGIFNIYNYDLYVNKLATLQEPIAIHIPYRTLPASYITHLNALQCGVMDRNGDIKMPYHVVGVQ
jgi:hypothetical protein